MKKSPLILPSLLSADMTALGAEVTAVMSAGADMIHLDVMDQHYVPNLTMGPLVLEDLKKKFPNLAVDVHLMVQPVDALAETFGRLGATRISFHPEASRQPARTITTIRNTGAKVGLALNPMTSIDWLTWCYDSIDFVLVMLVNPGFGNQKLIPSLIRKIEAIRTMYKNLPIQVDGGVNLNNLKLLQEAGATAFVMGSAIFNQTAPYSETIHEMRKILA